MNNSVVKRVANYYISSGDFNGLPVIVKQGTPVYCETDGVI